MAIWVKFIVMSDSIVMFSPFHVRAELLVSLQKWRTCEAVLEEYVLISYNFEKLLKNTNTKDSEGVHRPTSSM